MKRIYVTACVMLLLTFNAFTAKAEDKESLKARIESMTDEQKEARYVEMKKRVQDIKDMDKSLLSKTERKQLRNELKDMNQEAKAIGRGGVYISFAGLIIIILLLILLL